MDKRGVILVVDDEKEINLMLKGFFSALGFDMLTAFDGNEAMKVIDSVALDLILLDIRMPGIDGIQILKNVRKTKPKTKVIIMTAFPKEVDKGVIDVGIDGFFPKPIEFSRLIDRIQYVLKESNKDTRYYPPVEKEEPKILETPKAKLLFIEPDEMTFDFMCMYFASKEHMTGEYEIKVVYSDKEGLNPLYDYCPDIVIMYEGLYNREDTKELAGLMMNSSHKPKTVILHGLIPKMGHEVVKLKQEGIQFCNQNTMDDKMFRQSNEVLSEFVAKECRKHGLVKER